MSFKYNIKLSNGTSLNIISINYINFNICKGCYMIYFEFCNDKFKLNNIIHNITVYSYSNKVEFALNSYNSKRLNNINNYIKVISKILGLEFKRKNKNNTFLTYYVLVKDKALLDFLNNKQLLNEIFVNKKAYNFFSEVEKMDFSIVKKILLENLDNKIIEQIL